MEETRHYFKVPFEITEHEKFKNMKFSAQALYMVLCRLANNYHFNEGWFYRSLKTLCKDTGFEIKTLVRAKKELLKNDFIEIKQDVFNLKEGRKPDFYRIKYFRDEQEGRTGQFGISTCGQKWD